ncbi:MAG: transposase, partial [Oscillospiraceae bacterium]|nr:transposase [Oscillospiraceae bacterium]
LDMFGERLKMIFAQYTKAINGMTVLLSIDVRYPVNCMIGIMKRIGIPKKLAFEAADLFKAQYGDEPRTAHDIYFGICETAFMLQYNGADGSKIVQAEENIARVYLSSEK